jgi:hypothetical protein
MAANQRSTFAPENDSVEKWQYEQRTEQNGTCT